MLFYKQGTDKLILMEVQDEFELEFGAYKVVHYMGDTHHTKHFNTFQEARNTFSQWMTHIHEDYLIELPF